MILTQVRVVHSETISPQQYESKKHEVELVFNTPDGESITYKDIDQISQRAMDAVRDFIGRPRKQIAPEVAPWKEPLEGVEKLEPSKGGALTGPAQPETTKPARRPKGAPPPKEGPVPFDDELPPAMQAKEKESEPEEETDDDYDQPQLPPSKWTEDQLITHSEWVLEAFEKAETQRDLKIILERSLEFLGVLKEKRPNENDRVTRAYRDAKRKLKKEAKTDD